MSRHVLALLLAAMLPTSALADEGHGPNSTSGFSHRFSRRAHIPEGTQLAVHYGLLQPILLRGFNAAIDVRYGRLVASYSHGQGLELPSASLTQVERDGGVDLRMPWSTGFGIGALLIDELYVLLDFKIHNVEVTHDQGRLDYRTVTVGLEIGYRLFLWRGLNIALAVRYWPNIYTGIDRDGVVVGSTNALHEPLQQGAQGVFANVLLGWAFDIH